MRRRTHLTAALLLFVACTFPSGTLSGQSEGAPASEAQAEGEGLELIFEREVFEYPAYDRRNPFRPLTDVDADGPRFEDLVLLGVVISAEPASSVALLGVRTVGGAPGALSRTFRVRTGESLGNNRILDIRSQQVLVEVSDFGVSQLRTLEMRRVLPQPQPTPSTPGPAAPTPPAPQDQGSEGPPETSSLDAPLERLRRDVRSEAVPIEYGHNRIGGWS